MTSKEPSLLLQHPEMLPSIRGITFLFDQIRRKRGVYLPFNRCPFIVSLIYRSCELDKFRIEFLPRFFGPDLVFDVPERLIDLRKTRFEDGDLRGGMHGNFGMHSEQLQF